MDYLDYLSDREFTHTKKILKELESVNWIKPLVNEIKKKIKKPSVNDKPFFFELRFAKYLHTKGYKAEYEYKTGVNDTSVDFLIKIRNLEMLIELVSIGISDKSKESLKVSDDYFEHELNSDSPDKKLSESGELLLVQQKIGEKVYQKNKNVKFPKPNSKKRHQILVDVRNLFGGMSQSDDFKEIVYGQQALEQKELKHTWEGKPILGLFDSRNTNTYAKHLKERIHVISFINEDGLLGDFSKTKDYKNTNLSFPNINENLLW